MPSMNGSCLCGKIRYRAEGDPVLTGVCHCAHCQKQTGTSYLVFVAVKRAGFSVVDGTPGIYETIGDSGKPVKRHFCRDCGSPVFSLIDVAPDFTMLPAGTLEDRSWVKPSMHLYCDSAQPWVRIDGDVTKFPKARVRA
jgi:hypothetical protein